MLIISMIPAVLDWNYENKKNFESLNLLGPLIQMPFLSELEKKKIHFYIANIKRCKMSPHMRFFEIPKPKTG